MFDPRLIKDINRGKCFVLVGSGPSTEMGYSSWASLAKGVFETVKKLGKVSDEAGYLKYFTEKKYPEIFTVAERDLGGRGRTRASMSAL